MALASPSNLLSLHNAGGKITSALPFRFAMRYDHNPKVTAIPDLALFNGLSPDDPGPKALPTLAECAVHLEMLEAFQALRQEVIHSKKLDQAFGMEPNRKTVYRKVWNGARRRKDRTYTIDKFVLKDTDFAGKRKDKWTYFLQIAAVRFHAWIRVVNRCLKDHDANGAPVPRYLLLPPLDILIIWHAYLLNCDDFKTYCAVQNLHHVQKIAFPWADIHNAIDRENWGYTLPSEQSAWLRENGNLDASLIDALSETTTDPKSPAWHLLKEFNSMTKKPWTEGLANPLVQTILKARTTRGANEALVNNVSRQVVFVDKMHGHRWIRSPAAHGTLRRAVDRYDKFLHLFRLYPGTFLVPTLDVDLVWHTHQCSAENYRQFVTERVGRFINHDDKIGRGTLDFGFTSAEEWYRVTYGEQYQVCLCWSCEAILEAVEKMGDDVLAVEDSEALIRDLSVRVEREVNYYREVETARRLGKNLPVGWNHRKAAS